MRRLSIAVLAGSAVLVSAVTAFAQESRRERPYRGVFASGTDQAQQVLTVDGSVGSGYDSNALLGAAESGLTPGSIDPRVGSGSVFTSYAAGLSYSASLEKLSAGASLSSSARQYPSTALSTASSHAASTGLSLALARNTRVNGGLSATYQSLRAFSPFAELGDPSLGQIEAPSQDFGTVRGNYYSYGVQAGLSQQLSRRTALTVDYDRHSSQFDRDVEDLTHQTGSFRITRNLTRSLALRLGYGYTDARYGIARQYQNHNLDSGVDYSRDLSLTRRTKLSFTSGATALRQSEVTRYDVIGSARLTREIARTWTSELSYQRNVDFLESVLEPTFYDSLNAGISGLITRRVSFHSSAAATRGTIGVTTRPQNGFGAWNASAELNAALTRHLALGVNYTFYRYNFEEGAALVTGLAQRVNRHSVSINVNAWAPLFQHGKRSNASR